MTQAENIRATKQKAHNAQPKRLVLSLNGLFLSTNMLGDLELGLVISKEFPPREPDICVPNGGLTVGLNGVLRQQIDLGRSVPAQPISQLQGGKLG